MLKQPNGSYSPTAIKLQFLKTNLVYCLVSVAGVILKVTAESQAPTHIPPPAAVIASSQTFILPEPSQSSVVITQTSSLQPLAAPLPMLQTSVMDGTENPFRPDGDLCHEVQVIVDSYKHRPFPTSPLHSPHRTGDASLTMTDSASPKARDSGFFGSLFGKKKSQQLDGPNGIANDKQASCPKVQADSCATQSVKPKDVRLSDAADGHATQPEVRTATLASPRTGRAEVVHIDSSSKKKGCACCSIQ